ncbi:hypothetical protein LZF95_10660 [Algoriphagus sp. AGSA1]|uniref:hypothetical protein n=1 Tax=Algoriphagus sp. AGSA1 TaxID=2907213 RepID=UPI001F2266B8|nr:hypothetical protein [Algoriphagus sp. AGSA1]MCE7055137.1 hypothetical protein [Algoriphagus sp. AGSA1]
MRKLITCLLIYLVSVSYGICQLTEESNYPEGIYKSKEDFLKKKPSSIAKIYPEGINREEIKEDNQLIRDIFFFDVTTGKKLKKVFAVSYQGNLYFQYGSIVAGKNRNKKDKDQTVNMLLSSAFAQVLLSGERYLYTELEIQSGWEQGLYSNMGLVGAAAMSNMGKIKGVVWDCRNSEFNIFRHCKDLNDFLTSHAASYSIACTDKKYDLGQLRLTMLELK